MSTTVDEKKFGKKLGKIAKTAGREVVEKALWLWYAAKNPKTPLWAKTTIASALVYLVVPIDAIPDIIPAFGLSDDLGPPSAASAAVASYIDDAVKKQATERLKKLGLL